MNLVVEKRLTHEEVVRHDNRGLYLYNHNFNLPLQIKEALEKSTSICAIALVFDGDVIYHIPTEDSEEYTVHTGEGGYINVLESERHFLNYFISTGWGWDCMDEDEQIEAKEIEEIHIKNLDEFLRTLKKN